MSPDVPFSLVQQHNLLGLESNILSVVEMFSTLPFVILIHNPHGGLHDIDDISS